MCGGEIEILPCSRIAHIFRKRRPYGAGHDTMAKNSIRTARVWLDQYLVSSLTVMHAKVAYYSLQEYFYASKPQYRTVNAGDISDRVALRQRLNCTSFQWYLENVYPSLLPTKAAEHSPPELPIFPDRNDVFNSRREQPKVEQTVQVNRE